jgi:uncharacterized protein
MCSELIHRYFNPEDWNLYAFHFSDGENYDDRDDQSCLNLLEEYLLPAVNLFCYGEVRSGIGPLFMDTLNKVESDKVSKAKINQNDDIYTAIKAFLGKGL